MLQNYSIDVTKLLQRRYKTMKYACVVSPLPNYRLLTIVPFLTEIFCKVTTFRKCADCFRLFKSVLTL